VGWSGDASPAECRRTFTAGHVSREFEKKLKALAAKTGRAPEQLLDEARFAATRPRKWRPWTGPMSSRGACAGQGERRLGASWNAHARSHHLREPRSRRNLDGIREWYDGLDRDQVQAVLDFAVRSLDPSAPDR
jgi:hypothetical protein